MGAMVNPTSPPILYHRCAALSIGKSAELIGFKVKDRAIIDGMNDFTAWANDAIQRRGWSISELARRSGFSQSLASDVLNEKADPSANFVISVADALGEDAVKLLRLAGHLPPAPPVTDLDCIVSDNFRRLSNTQRNAVATLVHELAVNGAERAPAAPFRPARAPISQLGEGEEDYPVQTNPHLTPAEERIETRVTELREVIWALTSVPMFGRLMDLMYSIREQQRREQEHAISDEESHPDHTARLDRSA